MSLGIFQVEGQHMACFHQFEDTASLSKERKLVWFFQVCAIIEKQNIPTDSFLVSAIVCAAEPAMFDAVLETMPECLGEQVVRSSQ